MKDVLANAKEEIELRSDSWDADVLEWMGLLIAEVEVLQGTLVYKRMAYATEEHAKILVENVDLRAQSARLRAGLIHHAAELVRHKDSVDLAGWSSDRVALFMSDQSAKMKLIAEVNERGV